MKSLLSFFLLLLPALCLQSCSYKSNGTCMQCLPGYYLPTTTPIVCTQCSIVGCSECSSATTCTTCKTNYTLVSSSCIYCPTTQFYDTASTSCKTCLANCQNCASNTTCSVCVDGYYVVKGTTGATPTDDVCTNASTTTPSKTSQESDLKEYLLAIMPRMRAPLYSREDVMSVCQSNGFTCSCPNLTTTTRCSVLDSTKVATIYSYLPTTLTATNYEAFALAVQAHTTNTTYTANILTTLQSINATTSNILTGKTDLYRMNLIFETIAKLYYDNINLLTLQNTTLPTISSYIKSKVFSTTAANQSIILQGNGFIYRLSNFVATNTPIVSYPYLDVLYAANVSGHSAQLLLFNRSLLSQPFSGILITYQNFPLTPTLTTQYKIPKLSSLQSLTGIFNLLRVTSITNQTQVSSIGAQNNSFVFTTNTTNKIYSIASTNSSDVFTSYDVYRIENLFYQNSIFYVLFFLLLYIIFFPLCLLVDFVDHKKTERHKNVRVREDGTAEDLRPEGREGSESVTDPSDEGTQVIVEISYKQFHPIYNIANTQHRPSRLHKLSLYLLNMQHSLTYLVVLYNTAPTPRTPIYAILLSIPAYILNILTGYLFGFIKNRLNKNWKFLINIVPVGYWVVWVFVMKSWTEENSPRYQDYLIIFVLILWLLDQIFDVLQMLTMYFVLRENNTVYPCISKVLGVRGYFEYEKYGPDDKDEAR